MSIRQAKQKPTISRNCPAKWGYLLIAYMLKPSYILASLYTPSFCGFFAVPSLCPIRSVILPPLPQMFIPDELKIGRRDNLLTHI